MGLSIGQSRLLSVEFGGYYGQANSKAITVPKGYVQKCMSEKCCTVYVNRKWTSKKTGESIEKRYVNYIAESKIKYRTKNRSELKDFCPDCGYTLFTERGEY